MVNKVMLILSVWNTNLTYYTLKLKNFYLLKKVSQALYIK